MKNAQIANLRQRGTNPNSVFITDLKLEEVKNSEYIAEVITAQDYYPFGMQLPGHSVSSGDYRYGFQGQEKDDEVKGNGNSINYKYRVHDPRIGRFLSVDPLAPSFAHNSPYAFSENRVIDGVELEGLEYYTYLIYFQGDKKVKTTLIDHTILKKGYGSLGPGVAYEKVQMDLEGKVNSKTQINFIKNNYGVYAGADPNNPKNSFRYNGQGYDYFLPAINSTDQVAKDHDQNYDAVGAIGAHDFWSNPYTIEADKLAVNEWQKISEMGEKGQPDAINGKEIGDRYFRVFSSMIFKNAIDQKLNVAIDMYFNDHGIKSSGFGKLAKINELGGREAVYQKWRSENMTQNSEGNWRKKD